MDLANDAITMDRAAIPHPPAVLIEHGEQTIYARGPIPDCLVEADQAWASGQQNLAGDLLCEEALVAIQKEVDANPTRVDLLYMAGQLLMNLCRFSQGLPIYRRAVDLEPCAAGFYKLSEMLQALGHVTEGLVWAQKAVKENPDHPDYRVRLAYCIFFSGQIEAGTAMMRQAFNQRPSHLNLLEKCVAWEHYLPGRRRGSFLQSYCELGRLISSGTEICKYHWNSPEPDRRLRIGVISPLFRRNSAAYTFEPFLDGYDREKLEVYAYANLRQEHGDETTERMGAKCDHFRFVGSMHTQGVFDLIQGDQIDILVQIAGYVGNHRLAVLARKPAPIQVVLGSADSTGLKQIDYRFTDAWQDPYGWDLPYVETSAYLPGGSMCYRPIQSPTQTSALPALKNGYVTFGAFHDHLKLNASVLKLWARIMDGMADARLIIKCGGNGDQGIRARLLERCRLAGLDLDRIEMLTVLPHNHLSLNDRVDLMLDAFPFNGAIMTLEGLWMGVPTVSLAGDLWLARSGHLILSQVGLEAFVADTPEAYVEKAIAFSQQRDALARIRAGLRETMLASSICNPHRFASEMTEAFRYMWYRWCRSQGAQVPHEEPAGLFVDS